MPQSYVKDYPADFPSLVTTEPNGSDLGTSIYYSGIAEALESITVGVPVGQCTVVFANALSPGDEATFDAIIAAHTGLAYATTMKACNAVVADPKTITDDLTWQLLAQITTTPSFFTEDLSQLVGRLVGQYQAVAGGGGELPQLRIVEMVSGLPDEDKLPPTDMAAQVGFANFGLSTSVPPRDGYHNTYQILARLNGAASFDMQWTTFSMLDAVPVTF